MDLVANLPKQDWLDKGDVGTTAEILDFNDERGELIVDVDSSKHSHPHSSQRGRAIPVSRVVSFEQRSRAEQPWPYSDPCRGTSFSSGRFLLLAMLFLSWTIGSLPLFYLLMKRPYGFQEASVVVYTIFVVSFTFASTGTRTGKDTPPYMFTCPAVQAQVSRLLWRHLAFLIALFVLQTLAFAARLSTELLPR